MRLLSGSDFVFSGAGARRRRRRKSCEENKNFEMTDLSSFRTQKHNIHANSSWFSADRSFTNSAATFIPSPGTIKSVCSNPTASAHDPHVSATHISRKIRTTSTQQTFLDDTLPNSAIKSCDELMELDDDGNQLNSSKLSLNTSQFTRISLVSLRLSSAEDEHSSHDSFRRSAAHPSNAKDRCQETKSSYNHVTVTKVPK